MTPQQEKVRTELHYAVRRLGIAEMTVRSVVGRYQHSEGVPLANSKAPLPPGNHVTDRAELEATIQELSETITALTRALELDNAITGEAASEKQTTP